MTPQELTARARQYVSQALDHVNTLSGIEWVRPPVPGEWVSLRANLESALADLDTVLAQPATEP